MFLNVQKIMTVFEYSIRILFLNLQQLELHSWVFIMTMMLNVYYKHVLEL